MIKDRKPYVVFFSIIAAGTVLFYLISSGYYPIAIVNNSFISARTFTDDYTAASFYYQNILKAYNSIGAVSSTQASSSAPQIPTKLQIQQSVLNGLIESVLIDGGARKEIGKELDRIVEEKIAKAASARDMEKAAKAVYGIGFNDFKKEVLVPQAKRDALMGSLLLKGEKMDEWLANAKKTSRVVVFSDKFYWNGEEIVGK